MLGAVVLSTPAWTMASSDDRFFGGSYDGYGLVRVEQFVPSGSPRFLAGPYDGYAAGVFSQYDGGSSPQQVAPRFLGGSYDGYSRQEFLPFSSLTSPQFTGPRFHGGSFDGAERDGVGGVVNPLNFDTDGDGLVDWWEAIYFNSLALLSASGDYDLDGSEDGQELDADTDPSNSNSYFHIIATDATNSITVLVSSTNSRIYSMQFSTNLMGSSWLMVDGQTNLPGEAAGVLTLTDTNAAFFRAYRVQVQRP